MDKIQIFLDRESALKLDACAKFRRVSREQMLRLAIDAAVRHCWREAQESGLSQPEAAEVKPADEGGIFSKKA